MGDAADDMYDAEMRAMQEDEEMLAAGCKRCENCNGGGIFFSDAEGLWPGECPKCHGCGWFDKDGKPCEQ